MIMQRRVRPRELIQAIKGVYHRYCTELVEHDVAEPLPSARARALAWFRFPGNVCWWRNKKSGRI